MKSTRNLSVIMENILFLFVLTNNDVKVFYFFLNTSKNFTNTKNLLIIPVWFRQRKRKQPYQRKETHLKQQGKQYKYV